MSFPIDPFIEQQGALILDGGLATELEKMNIVLDTRLWSAQVLISDPAAIKSVHSAYLEAGADCIITASYQMSFAECMRSGLSEQEIKDLLLLSVSLACEARDEFWATNPKGRIKPLVAASIGPYGAFLADGSEYTGDYGVERQQIYDFHAKRFGVLAGSDADILACETIPSKVEAEVLLTLMNEYPGLPAYISFSCMDDKHINDSTTIRDCAALFQDVEHLAALGVNCTAPQHITGLVKEVKTEMPNGAVVAYPNSGERYEVHKHSWEGTHEVPDFAHESMAWHKAGATMIGGCCRTGPEDIKAIRESLLG